MSSTTTIAILFGLLLALSLVTSQSIDDNLSLYMEYLHPGWRKHRARYMPFVFSQPIHVYRVAKRSIEGGDDDLNAQTEDLVQCIYNSGRVLCLKGLENYVECDAKLKFTNEQMSNFNTFGIAKLQTTEDYSKFTLLPKIPTELKTKSSEYAKSFIKLKQGPISIHTNGDNTQDEGLEVQSEDCWDRMIEFLDNTNATQVVNVEKVSVKNMIWTEKQTIIGSLHVVPEDSYLSF